MWDTLSDISVWITAQEPSHPAGWALHHRPPGPIREQVWLGLVWSRQILGLHHRWSSEGRGERRVRRKLLEREHGTTCARSAQKDEVIEKIQEQWARSYKGSLRGVWRKTGSSLWDLWNPSLKPSGSKTEIVNTDILFFYYLMFLSPRAECSVARCVQMSKIWSKAAEGNLLCYFYSCFYSQVEQGKIWTRLTTAHVIYIKCSSIISGASLINMSSDVLKLRLRFVSRCWVYSGVKPGDTCIIWMGRIFYFSFLHIVSRIYVPNCNTPS